jgi:hypothetical protein
MTSRLPLWQELAAQLGITIEAAEAPPAPQLQCSLPSDQEDGGGGGEKLEVGGGLGTANPEGGSAGAGSTGNSQAPASGQPQRGSAAASIDALRKGLEDLYNLM